MSLCEQEEWTLSCAFEHSWKINLQDSKTLSSTFKSHNGNYEWCVRLKGCYSSFCPNCTLALSSNYCPLCGTYVASTHDKLKYYCLNLSLQKFTRINGINSSNLEKKKMDVQIFSASNKENSIKKEVCIDKEKSIFTINLECLDAKQLFLNKKSNLTIVVKIFDITNQSTGGGRGFERLLKSGECSDFKIIVDKKEFFVHKCILAAKSNYFSAMFKHDTKEKIEGVMIIPDTRVEVMNELINFIYGIKVDLKDALLFDLLTAADVYQVQDLKTICEKSIISNLTIGNLGECIEYADTYNNEYLKNETIQFIIKKKQSDYKFSDNDINHLEARLTSVSSSYSALLVCSLLK